MQQVKRTEPYLPASAVAQFSWFSAGADLAYSRQDFNHGLLGCRTRKGVPDLG